MVIGQNKILVLDHILLPLGLPFQPKINKQITCGSMSFIL